MKSGHLRFVNKRKYVQIFIATFPAIIQIWLVLPYLKYAVIQQQIKKIVSRHGKRLNAI